MKYTDRELEDILNKLIASTRSPRGRFSAASSYPQLEKKLNFRNRRLYLTRTFAAAAAVVLLCLSVWTAYLYMQPATIQTVSTLAETRTVHLPDGTSVTLNHYSSLSYPERFKSDNREVELSGEAYFEVSKDPKHPFIVQTETIDVQVLGTHFNVGAYPDNPDVKTTLLTGSVAVSNKNNSVRMVLKPNEAAIYNKVEQSLLARYWRMPEMKFHGATGSSYSMICRCRRLPANFPTRSEQPFTLPTQPCEIIGSQRDSVMEKTWMRFYLYCIMPVISTIHETLNRLLLLKTRLNENYSPRTPTYQNARSDRYGDPYHRTGIRTECKCPTHNHIAKCYIEGVRQVNRKL